VACRSTARRRRLRPWDQASIVVAGAIALGLIGTLVPAAFVGRARLTALAGLRE
jgi:hypothetical protein